LEQQRPQSAVAAFADGAGAVNLAGSVPPRREPDMYAYVAGFLKPQWVVNLRLECERRNNTDSRDRHQPFTNSISLCDSSASFIQCPLLLEEAFASGQQCKHGRAHPLILFGYSGFYFTLECSSGSHTELNAEGLEHSPDVVLHVQAAPDQMLA